MSMVLIEVWVVGIDCLGFRAVISFSTFVLERGRGLMYEQVLIFEQRPRTKVFSIVESSRDEMSIIQQALYVQNSPNCGTW
jgi:hypothetical protein